MKQARLFINGVWREGAGQFPVLDKYTGEQIANAEIADADLVDQAVEAARTAFRGGEIPLPDRYTLLMRARDILMRRREEILDALVAETGFTRDDNAGDFARCEQTLLTSAEEAKRITGEMIPIAASPGHPGELAFTIRVPLGVVACITPFNSPLNTVAHKIAPALAAGNAVVLKPASYTPMAAVLLTEVFEEAGLPSGWLNLIHGPGSQTGRALCDNPDVAYFAFTGGGPAGAAIQAAAGMRRTQMELGNISAAIVCEDADLDRAAGKCIGTAFRKAGQVCTSLQRIYVARSAIAEFTERFIARTAALVTGDPRDPATDIGPMVDAGEAARAERMVTDSIAKGAQLRLGGARDGALMAPTILENVTPDMPVLSEEAFAPIVCLIPFDDFDAVIEAVNATPYGLSAGIFTRDIDRALTAAQGIEVGLFNINNTSSNRADPMPYGGCKASGWGREGPRAAIRDMTEERLITITPG
ncbi:MAG: aldehyde dehydrogenase family protein [Rhodobacteraceae bacterium]|nr:aldehyde dehydrogenase family protein [Paracoccaceae bacterium]